MPTATAPPKEPLSSRNVGSLSTYDIRQELVRRDILKDIPTEDISHRTMLHRLVRDLVEEEGRIAESVAEVKQREEGCKRDEAKALRDRKKQEALERSRARQADPAYFAQKQREAEEALAMQRQREAAVDTGGAALVEEVAEEEEEEEGEEDPFRTTKPRRNRVFVR